MRIVVTGGSGKAGRWVVRDLREHGHDVLNVDLRHDGSPHGAVRRRRPDRPRPGARRPGRCRRRRPPRRDPGAGAAAEGETFRINALSTYNVFAAAVAAGVRRVVWASWETVLGLPFDRPPDFAPIDETIDAAARVLVRAVEARRRDDGRAVRPPERHRLRRAADLEHHGAGRLRGLPVVLGRPAAPELEPVGLRRRARRGARRRGWASRPTSTGRRICIVAAADTVMTQPSAELMAEVFPDVPAAPAGRGSRDAPVDRPGARAPRLRAGPPLGGPRRVRDRGRLAASSAVTATASRGARIRATRRRRAADRASCARPVSRRSRRSRRGRSPTRAGSGAPPPTTSASPGSDRPRTVLDASGGPAWARWWTGGAFDWSWAAVEPRAARDPDGVARRWEGEDGEVRDLTNARAGRGRRAAAARSCRRSASGRATGSGSSCRCCPRRSSRSSRSAASGRSSRRSSRATPRRPSRPASPTARRRAAHHRRRVPAARRVGRPQGGGRCGGRRRRRRSSASLVVRRGRRRAATCPGTDGRDVWWDDARRDRRERGVAAERRPTRPRDAVHGHLHLGHDRPARRARSTSTAASRSRPRRTSRTPST